MIKAVFIDFYGTVVHEDGEVIKQVSQEIYSTGKVTDKSEIGTYWWNEFQKAFNSAYEDSFETQRKLEYESLKKTIEYFNSTANAKELSDLMFAHWIKPPIFEESKQFFEMCPVPIYVVSNIDRDDVLKAIEYHGLKPNGIFTSEDAKSYKPRKELFQFALNSTGLSAERLAVLSDDRLLCLRIELFHFALYLKRCRGKDADTFLALDNISLKVVFPCGEARHKGSVRLLHGDQ